MLVLSRKSGQVINIGDDVTVKIIRIGENSVKIGIEAPAHVRVLRSEIAGPADVVPFSQCNEVRPIRGESHIPFRGVIT